MTTDLARIEQAARSAGTALHAALVEDVAARLTCSEAEAVAELYRSLGYSDIAADVLDAHASRDAEPADLHHAAWLAQQAADQPATLAEVEAQAERDDAECCTCRADVPEAPGSGGYLARIAGCPVHDAWANAR